MKFDNAIFERLVDFEGTNFMLAGFRYAKFCKYVGFEDTTFSGYAAFEHVEFMGEANFSNAQFSDGADAYFRGAQFDKIFDIRGARFTHFVVSWGSIKNRLVYDGPVFFALVNSFKISEQFEDADDCYYQYRLFRKNFHQNSRKSKVKVSDVLLIDVLYCMADKGRL